MNRCHTVSFFIGIGVALLAASCASDVADSGEPWQVEERAIPIPPPELDRELVWHFEDERVEPLVPWGVDVWGEDAYRVPMSFNGDLTIRSAAERFNVPYLSKHPAFIGVGEPFFDDGRIRMLEMPSSDATGSVYRFGRLEFHSGLSGHVVYEDGAEPRTEPYQSRDGDDLPEPLATWVEAGGLAITVFLYRPDINVWLRMRVSTLDCTIDVYNCYGFPGIRDVGDPRLLFFRAQSDYEVLDSWPAARSN